MTTDPSILALLRDGKPRMRRDIAKALGIHRSSAWRHLVALVAKGKVARVKVLATGRVTYYLVS